MKSLLIDHAYILKVKRKNAIAKPRAVPFCARITTFPTAKSNNSSNYRPHWGSRNSYLYGKCKSCALLIQEISCFHSQNHTIVISNLHPSLSPWHTVRLWDDELTNAVYMGFWCGTSPGKRHFDEGQHRIWHFTVLTCVTKIGEDSSFLHWHTFYCKYQLTSTLDNQYFS